MGAQDEILFSHKSHWHIFTSDVTMYPHLGRNILKVKKEKYLFLLVNIISMKQKNQFDLYKNIKDTKIKSKEKKIKY